jgi:methyl-accepting chemotaxis protein
MTNEQMERAIEFLLDHHAKFSADIGELKDVQQRQAENLDKLTGAVTRMQQEMEANRQEIRETIDNLIIANEGTRKLAEDVARLIVQTSQRVSGLDRRVDDLEQKP